MVITDDRFSTIVAAVEEGRAIFDNIRKTLGYLLAGNAAELAVVLLATLAGAPLPLLPVQLLWINLVTDGLPALALATDPGDPDVLSRPPRRADSPLADGRMVTSIALVATLTAGVTTAAFSYELLAGEGLAAARNAAFSVLVFAELLRAFGARSENRPVWRIGLFSNLRLFGVVAASFALQFALHRVDALQRVFQTEAVGAAQYVAWFALAAVPLLTVELGKVVRARQADGKRRTSSGPR
jgi:Ca2+-transporting ATPase